MVVEEFELLNLLTVATFICLAAVVVTAVVIAQFRFRARCDSCAAAFSESNPIVNGSRGLRICNKCLFQLKQYPINSRQPEDAGIKSQPRNANPYSAPAADQQCAVCQYEHYSFVQTSDDPSTCICRICVLKLLCPDGILKTDAETG